MTLLIEIGRFLLNRSKEQWLAAAALTTAASYTALYVAYFQFYVALGLRPADVGLTRLRLLQESVIALILLPFTQTFFMHPRWLLIALAVATGITLWVSHRRQWPRADVVDRLTGVLVAVGLTVTFGLGLYGYVRMTYDASWLGDAVASDGYLTPSWVTNLGWPVFLPVPYLDVQALPVTIRRTDASPLEITEGCTVYLGQSESQVVLYDVRREKVVRVPVSGTQVITHPGRLKYNDSHLDPKCMSNDGNEAAWPD